MSVQTAAPRVLVVEDEPEVAETYRTALRDEFEVDLATSAEEALDIVADGHDVVVVDQRLSDRPGDHVISEINERNLACRIVKVLEEEPEVGVLELRCTDYVVTPVDGQELIETVGRVVRIGEYADRRRELGSKKLKRNVMEVEHSRSELADDETYQELNDEIRRLEAAVDEIESELGLENVDRFL